MKRNPFQNIMPKTFSSLENSLFSEWKREYRFKMCFQFTSSLYMKHVEAFQHLSRGSSSSLYIRWARLVEFNLKNKTKNPCPSAQTHGWLLFWLHFWLDNESNHITKTSVFMFYCNVFVVNNCAPTGVLFYCQNQVFNQTVSRRYRFTPLSSISSFSPFLPRRPSANIDQCVMLLFR